MAAGPVAVESRAAVEILLGAPHLAGPGGVQTYMLTVAAHLERLGHGVWLWAEQQGEMADVARERGLRVAATEAQLPARVDGVLAQDGVTALTLAVRYPDAVRAIVVHGVDFDLNFPPQAAGTCQAAIAMNAATERRARAAAIPLEVVRLRQPIDHYHFKQVGPIRERPQRALLLGNYLEGPRRDELLAGLAAEGIACAQVGRHGTPVLDPRAEIAQADVVIGQGRCLLEAMACGRAAFAFGPSAGDGWITRESYPAIEADGFRGAATETAMRVADVVAAMDGYDPGMGEVNRALVVQHHMALDHATALSELLARLSPEPPPTASLAEALARAKRVEYAATSALLDVQRDLRVAHERLALLDAQRGEWEHRVASVEAFKRTRRYRIAQALAAPFDAARRLRGRR